MGTVNILLDGKVVATTNKPIFGDPIDKAYIQAGSRLARYDNIQASTSNTTTSRVLSAQARQTLDRLNALMGDEEKLNEVLSGQFAGYPSETTTDYARTTNHPESDCKSVGRWLSFAASYRDHIERLDRETGKHVSIVGTDYGFSDRGQVTAANALLKAHSRRGGLVTISWHASNPWTDGSNPWTESPNPKSSPEGPLSDLFQGNNASRTNWENYLVEIADALSEFKDDGEDIPILWRPLHEMNGDWFWWSIGKTHGSSTQYAQNFKALWQDMFRYFSETRGLDNLLWVYAPNDADSYNHDDFYPGDEYVDVIALDLYDKNTIENYQVLTSAVENKPFGLAEFGGSSFDGCGDFDDTNSNLIDILENPQYDRLAFFQVWHRPWAIVDQPRARELMSNSKVINCSPCGYIAKFLSTIHSLILE